jgi:uncharacterized HhH-GPD family protein
VVRDADAPNPLLKLTGTVSANCSTIRVSAGGAAVWRASARCAVRFLRVYRPRELNAMARLQLTSDTAADTLLSEDPFALLVGMLLDQQIPMEVAFAGPRKIADRLGGLDPRAIAGHDPVGFAAMCAESPAVHRFPGSMAKRVQDLAGAVVQDYDGDTAGLWTRGDPDGAEVLRRLKALPGFGEQKARIFLALADAFNKKLDDKINQLFAIF